MLRFSTNPGRGGWQYDFTSTLYSDDKITKPAQGGLRSDLLFAAVALLHTAGAIFLSAAICILCI